jgi:hypothetical protein
MCAVASGSWAGQRPSLAGYVKFPPSGTPPPWPRALLDAVHVGYALGAEALAIEEFALKRGEEALAERVVVRVTDAAHR